MAETRCPMCGKVNPSEQSICRHCGARLRPIWDADPADRPKDDVPDWLRSLGGDLGEPGGAGITAGESTPPDWLSELRSQDEGEARGQQPTDESGLSAGEEDWLNRIGSAGSATPVEPDQESGSEPAQPEGRPNEMDWLSEAEVDLPDWLKSTGKSAEAPAGEDAGQEDWEARIDRETPEWLKSISAGATSSEVAPEGQVEPEPSPVAELPGWLEAEPPAEISTEIPFEAGESEETELPDWLKAEVPAGVPAGAVSEGPDRAEQPDDLQQAEIEPDSGAAEIIDFTPPPVKELVDSPDEVDDLSAWLNLMDNEEKETEAEGQAGAPGEESDLSWLGELESTYSGLEIETGQTQADYGSLSVGSAEEELSPAGAGDLPDWLTGPAIVEELPAEETAAAEAADLNLAELPSWLEAMRPVGAAGLALAAADVSTPEHTEGAGPLAGLQGALPAEPDVSQVEKPPVYSVRLNVAEAQELQAKMLTEMIAAEVQPAELAGRPVATSQAVLRVIIAAGLILALLVSIVIRWPYFSPPLVSPDLTAAYNLIESLPAGTAVLFAIDYSPGFSAEMDTQTVAVLTHLFSKGVAPVFISTLPTGPAQAERLVRQINLTHNQVYASGRDYINLGFLTGGSVGMASFLQSPQAVLQVDVSGNYAWELPPLQAVQSLSGFPLILVATESPERAREWIEQIRSRSTDAQIFTVVSAQAVPLIRPYYLANPQQVQAVSSGLSGAVMYETNRAQTGPAARYWSPYNLGLVLAVALMVLAGLVSFTSSKLANRPARPAPSKQPRQEGKTA